MGFASARLSLASELSAIGPSPSGPVPGLVLIKSANIIAPNVVNPPSITTITVDAPRDADFRKYRAILFRFSGIGFASAASDLTVTPRREGLTVPGNTWYQINQITATTTTGWVNNNASPTITVTSGGLVAANVWVNRWDVLMTPTGFDCDIRLGNSTTLPTGSIITTTASYTVTSEFLSTIETGSYPGVTLGTTGNPSFTAARYSTARVGVGLNCEIYGYAIS
jgi:hypothetical protein